MKELPKEIYFDGASWGCCFYIGCYKAMLERWGKRRVSKINFHGVSSGALIALCIILGFSVKKLEDIYKRLAYSAKTKGVIFKMTKYHNEALDVILNCPDAYKKANKRLKVGVTVFPKKYVVYDNWNSNEELRHTMHCTFHIPFYCRYPARIGKTIALDGGFRVSKNEFPRSTLIIGADKDTSDISACLSYKTALFPIIGKKYEEILEDGYKKLMDWKIVSSKIPRKVMPMPVWWFVRLIETPFLSKT